MNKAGSKILHGLLLATSGLVGSSLIASTAAMAGGGPTGGTVAVGSATIVNTSPTQTVVNQSSNKAFINWNSFSIPTGSSVTFNQPTSKSLTVNRVTGPNASTIDGALLANGNVWLLNANGVLFGKGSQINVGALLATTSDLSESDFKSGNYAFKPSTNPDAAVVNRGTITAGSNGSVVLSAPRVSNEGLIKADLGTVVLGGATAFTVDMTGDNLLRYQITAPVTDAPKDANGSVASALVSNSGTIMAAGGRVMMTARAARNIEDNVINNTGLIEATSVSSHNGEIDLDAGPDGTVNDSGTLNASGKAQGETGGAVNITGNTVNVADGAKIDASGNSGGGTVQIGGGLHGQGGLAHAQTTNVGKATIVADATGKGNGGTVVLWSDGATNFAGTISAKGGAKGGNGGQVETSGHNLGISNNATVSTLAPLGLNGDWLLDPNTITIALNGTLTIDANATGSGSISVSSIISALGSGNVTLEATSGNVTGAININADIDYSSANTLSLLSEGSITANASIQNSGSGSINVVAGWDGTTTDFSPTMSSSVYGQNGGNFIMSTSGTDIAIGSLGGQTLIAGNDVALTSGGGDAQIGYHGAGGGGNIVVLAAGNLTLSGGGDYSNAAIIGNGVANQTVAGNVTGDIYVSAGGTMTIDQNLGAVYLGNIAAQNLTTGNVTVSYQETGNVTLITNGSDLSGDYLANDLGVSSGAGGNVFVGFTATSGTTQWELGDYTTANTFTIASAANLEITGDIANSGSGGVNVIAGWDGHTTDLTALSSTDVANATAYGLNNGSVTIDSASVGSAGGKTTVAGYDISLNANGGNSQIGYQGNGGGDIYVLAKDAVNVLGGGVEGGYAQIGNGDNFGGITGDTGNITVVALSNVEVTGGSNANYAQIGNGGANLAANASGDVSVAAKNVDVSGGIDVGSSSAYAQIGNGGAGFAGTIDGNTSIHASGALTLSGGRGESYAQVGNGGDAAHGKETGNIAITTAGNVAVRAGAGYAQIGNGGRTSHGKETGDINITAGGKVSVVAAGDYAQIGNGGWSSVGNDTGNISINATRNIAVTGGNGSISSYAQIGNGGETQSGSDSGNISLQGANLVITAANNGRYAQIGNGSDASGAGSNASGDIGIDLTGNLTLVGATTSSAGSDYALIGNTAVSTGPSNGASSGNISVTAAGTITIQTTAGQGDVWIGNRSDGGAETGWLSLLAGNIDGTADNNGDFSQFVIADLSGGNVTVGTTDASITHEIAGIDYDSSNALTVLSAGNLAITGDLQNSGSGDITIVAGWNPAVAPANVLTASHAYGNGGKTLTIGGAAAAGNVAVGSAHGTTNILTGALTLSANNGYAQIGYHGAGDGTINVSSTGNIIVQAIGNGDHAQIGNGDWATSGNVGGNISVATTGGNLTLTTAANNAAAVIGNIAGTNGSESGDIAVNTKGGALSLGSTGNISIAQIGNWANGDTTGTSSGNITVSAGDVNLNTAGIKSFATIGNGNKDAGFDTGALSGDISLDARTLSMSSDGSGGNIDQSRIGNLGDGVVSGNIDITTTGNIILSGAHAGLSNIGNLSVPTNSAQGEGTGDIVVQAGGSISLLGNGGEARIESGGATDGNVSVTAVGDITLAVDNAASTGEHGTAIIGALASGDSTINVAVTSTRGQIALDAADDGSFVGIGSSENGSAGVIGGNVNVVASDSANGSITVSATGAGSIARIGNSGNGSATSGDISVLAGNALQIVGGNSTASNGSLALIGNTNDQPGGTLAGNVTVSAVSADGIGNSIFNDLAGGDFTLSSLGTKTIVIDDTGTYNSSHNLTVNSGGDVVFDTSLQNSGSGNITFVSAGNVTIGGAGAGGGVAVGSMGGTTTITAEDLLLSAMNGYAQIGYHGGGTGAINVTTTGGITLGGGAGADDYAQIGDGGYQVSGSSNVAITVTAGGDIALTGGGGLEAYAQIGNGGAESNTSSNGYHQTGLVTVTGQSVTLSGGNGQASYAQIGHGGYKSGQSLDGTATIGGDVVVSAVSGIHLTGDGADAYAQIGNGGDFVNNQSTNGSGGTIFGSISATVSNPSGPGDPVTLTGGSGANSYAQIGNGGQGENTPISGAAVTLTVSDNVIVSDLTLMGGSGTNAYAQLGNGDGSQTGTGNISGDITFVGSPKLTIINGTGKGANAAFGNATGFGTVTGTVYNSNPDGGDGSVAYIIQDPVSPTYIVTIIPQNPQPPTEPGSDTSEQTPLDQLSDGGTSEGSVASDKVANSVGQSLGGGKAIYVTSKTLIPGMLKQIVTANNPRGVPPADTDYSSWGNEAFWRW